MKTTTKAVVTLQIEVHLPQPWGGTDSLDSVYKTASRQAIEKLARVVEAKGVNAEFQIVPGSPRVTAVLCEEIQ